MRIRPRDWVQTGFLVTIIVTVALVAPAGATPFLQEEDPEAQAEALFDEGWTLLEAGQWESALSKLEAALSYYQAADDKEGAANCLLFIGFAKQESGDRLGALDAYKASLPLWRAIDNWTGEGTALSNIGSVYFELRQHEQALEAFGQALGVWREAEYRPGEAVALSYIGSVYDSQGQYEQGLDYHQRALTIHRETGDAEGEAVTLSNIAAIYDDVGEYNQALDLYQTALEICRANDFLEGEGRTLTNIGLVYSNLGEFELALDYFQRALAVQQGLGERAGESSTLTSIGAVYDHLGYDQEALDYYQQALEIQRAMEDREGEAVTINNMGAASFDLGQYQRALDHYQQALGIQQAIGDRAGEALSLSNIGGVYVSLGQQGRAMEYFEQALLITQEIGDRAGEATALNNVGFVNASLGDYPEALANYQLVVAICQEIGFRLGEGASLSNIGEMLRSMGRYQEALGSCEQGLAIAREVGAQTGEAVALNCIGAIYHDVGQYNQALEQYRAALAALHEIGALPEEAVALANIGVLYEDQADAARAIDYFRQSVEVLESVQGGIKIEELKASFAGEQLATYTRLVSLLWQEHRIREAFNCAETARARAFLDQIGNRQIDFRQTASPELSAEEQALRQQIIGLQATLNAERSKPFDQQNQELLEGLSVELEGARSDHEGLMTRLKLESPEYASLVSVSTLSLEEVQNEVLDENTTLVEYFILDEQTLAWVVDRDGFEPVALQIGRDDLRNSVEFLRNLIDSQDYDPQIAAGLHDALFAPLKPHIRHANLVIVPHGVLHYLPFAALWDAEAERYLVEDYALTYAPSASALRFILDKRNADEGRLLALGNPDGSLLHSEAEAEAIAGLYDASPLLREQATESQVYAQAGEVDLLHLAAHGVYNPFNALYTRIELAPDEAQDGNLEVHEVFGLDLTGANLVVLSACETALGEQSEGDELVGLTRAFLYAGSPAVVTTLWPIDDAASGALMEAFYRHLHEGLTNAQALRAAELEVMAEEGWGEPYYWAAFSLTGDYLGSGGPGRVMAEMPEPAATRATVETSTAVAAVEETPPSAPLVEPSPTPGEEGGGLCGSTALPLGLVLLAGVSRLRVRRRGGP